MKLITLILLATILPAPARNDLTATWTSKNTAILRWTQPASGLYTCVSRRNHNTTQLIACWTIPSAGPASATIPPQPADINFRPQWGDRYWLEFYQGGKLYKRWSPVKLLGQTFLPVIHIGRRIGAP